MADAIVSFAVERLGDLLISESRLLYGVRGQIRDIQEELTQMQNFLKEADKRQIRDERVRGWVDRIKVLAFRIEDVIEIFALQVTPNSGFKKALRRFACISCHLISRHNVAMEINDIKAKLATIQQSLSTYGITKGLEEGEASSSRVNPKTQRISFPHDVENDFIGMEKETEQLISHLKNENKGCEVVSIWGMGGQGKTTLAQKLYNHVEIRDHFKAFAWVCISQQFDWEKVLKGILKQLLPDGRQGEVSNMDDGKLVDELRKVQQERKCLIVIDDIWTVDSWRLLKPAILLGDETTSGCKILLTTREKVVAKIGSVCEIPSLTEDEGWQLLSKKSGINDHPDIIVDSKIEKIGRKMVNSCRGLPLAISTLGGILKGKHLLREWEKINTDVTFYLAKGEGVTNDDDDEYYTVRRVLGLSYDNLPSRLRHCFLCFANYKEDETIFTEELYMFWMAEGLISVEDKAQGEMMLDVAERYLDELVHRSLVRIETHYVEGESWSKYYTCVVHDLIQDLCFSKVKEEGGINVIDLERKRDIKSKASTVRRLCVRSYDANRDVLEPYDPRVISHVRSLFFWNRWDDSVVWPDKIFSLEKFKLLRVLTARGLIFSKQNMRSISELVYLKYLCLSECGLKFLPSSIGKLRNLETLDLRTEGGLTSIPNVLWKLKKLKHLYLPVDFCVRGRAKKLRLEGLNELELISNFDSEYCDAHNLFGLPKLKVFDGFVRVQENLTAENTIDFIKSRELRHTAISVTGEVSLVSLLECCFIDALRIYSSSLLFPKVDDYTRFSGRLTQLWLENIETEEDPMILLGELRNLRSLGFVVANFLEGEIVCSATSFPKLKTLIFDKVKGLRGWMVEKGAMPNLSNLIIEDSPELEMPLPEGLIHLTSLKTLNIHNMPTTFTDKIKAVDGTEGPDFYKVGHIPNLIIYRRP